MFKLKKIIKVSVLLVAVILILCSCQRSGASSGAKQHLVIKSSYMRTPIFLVGSVLEGLINYNTNYISVNISEKVNENEKILSLNNGSADLVFLSGPEGNMAYNGHPAYWESPQKIKYLFGIFPTMYSGLVHSGSEIRQLADLVGKKIALNTEGSVSGDLLYYFLRLNGIDTANSIIYRVEQPEGFRLFCNHQVDFIWYNMSAEYSFLKNPVLGDDFMSNYNIVSCTPHDKLREFLSVYPLFYTDTGYSAEDSSDPTRCLAASTYLACSSTLPDEVAYTVTKVWFENIDYISAFFPFYSENNAKVYFNKKIPIPMHPGAERYFREAGLMN